MAKAAKPEYTPEQVQSAAAGWHIFTVFTKWSCIVVTVVLVLMAMFLL